MIKNAKHPNYLSSAVHTLIKSAPKKNTVMYPADENTVAHCVGRYRLNLPSSMNCFSEFYKIGDLLLQEELFSYPLRQAYKDAWQKKIDAIEALKKERNSIKDSRGKIVEKKLLTDTISGVLYYGNAINDILTLNALYDADVMGLWFHTEGGQDSVCQMEEHIKKIAASYHFAATTDDPPAGGKNLFYLTHGAVACSPLDTEEASVYFDNYKQNIEIGINTKTLKTPAPGLFERFELTMMNPIAWKNGGITFLKKRIHKIGSFKGEEIFYHDKTKNKLAFLWSYTGEPNSGRYPEITVSMNTPDKETGKMIDLWEKIINSIQSVTQ